MSGEQLTVASEAHADALRANFHQLLLENPGYFVDVVKKASDTHYEQLTCVGYNPTLTTLEATFQIKRSTGYNGSLCQSGSTEYIRFFLDYGTGWEDAGLVAVNVHDIPNETDCDKQSVFPLTYVATLKIEPKTNFCGVPVLPNVRAILSWNSAPPAGPANAGKQPIWGNILDHHVQIKPRQRYIIDLVSEIAAELKQPIKIPPIYEAVATTPIPIPNPGPLKLGQLAQKYGAGPAAPASAATATRVPAHRFGLSDVHAALAAGNLSPETALAKGAEWKAVGLDLAAAIAALQKTEADESYEQLDCLGLDYNLERLVATFRIKRSAGYSGSLCQNGSQEYVSFWADWDDTCQFMYLGTVAVNVHDISPLPADGLAYSAVLPVDLTNVRRECAQPKLARVRAVLSWEVPPSTTDPNALNYYGNRIDCHVQIKPGAVVQPGTVTPIIGLLGGIPISEIDLSTGLTTPTAAFALNGLRVDNLGRPCPFGGRVVVQGPSYPGYRYRVQVRRIGDPGWTTVTTPMTLVDWTGTVFTSQIPDGSGYFAYVPFTLNVDNVLAWWDTTGDEPWEVQLDIETVPGVASHRIQLDNTWPDIGIHIDNMGDCGKYTVGTTLQGHFVARDAYFGSYSLGTSPFAGPVVPASGTTQTAVAPGDTWSLNTTTMTPCGYVVSVTAVDRAIVNSSSVGHWITSSAGFCLEEAP